VHRQGAGGDLDSTMIPGVFVTPLRRIDTLKGEVMHGLKASEATFAGFGEAYFSVIVAGSVKGWKKHSRVTLNLVVPVGAVRFVLFDEVSRKFSSFLISRKDNYCRLTVPPGIWVAFQGIGGNESMLLNVASHEHDAEEAESLELSEIPYDWRL